MLPHLIKPIRHPIRDTLYKHGCSSSVLVAISEVFHTGIRVVSCVCDDMAFMLLPLLSLLKVEAGNDSISIFRIHCCCCCCCCFDFLLIIQFSVASVDAIDVDAVAATTVSCCRYVVVVSLLLLLLLINTIMILLLLSQLMLFSLLLMVSLLCQLFCQCYLCFRC